MATLSAPLPLRAPSAPARVLSLLWRDKAAFVAVLFLLAVLFCVVFGPSLLGEAAAQIQLTARNSRPFDMTHGRLFFLGGDAVGRPILARIVVGARNTVVVAAAATLLSMTVGIALGLIAGYRSGRIGNLILRTADVVMSFPSLLLALIVLYVLEPALTNVVLVIAITRVPIWIRTSRAEALEIRERAYVTAARTMGSHPLAIVLRHILPAITPTIATLSTLEFAMVMLAESTLSFLGLGIQPPAFSWGLMVAQGQNYLASAWWLAFWPGLAITLTACAMNVVANWLRLVTDPLQRWRLDSNPTPTKNNA